MIERVLVHRGNPRSRGNHARQVERIGGRDQGPGGRGGASRRSRSRDDGRFQGELLAADAGDEPAAADFAPQLQPPQHADQLPPGGAARLAGQQIAKQHAVTGQQLPAPAVELRWADRAARSRRETATSGRSATMAGGRGFSACGGKACASCCCRRRWPARRRTCRTKPARAPPARAGHLQAATASRPVSPFRSWKNSAPRQLQGIEHFLRVAAARDAATSGRSSGNSQGKSSRRASAIGSHAGQRGHARVAVGIAPRRAQAAPNQLARQEQVVEPCGS